MSVPVFDVCGPLPTGTVVLEASAGTGKTTTIASLAARYVAEGVARLPDLMLVTFGRMATSELRDRVRARLTEVERALRAPGAATSTDEVVALLARVDDDERGERAARLTRALAEFDAATITTTHGFCQQMLATLGTVGDVDHDATLVPDVAELEAEVVDDLYLRKYVGSDAPLVSVVDARAIAHESISDHDAHLEPASAAPDTAAQHRYGIANAARAEFRRRKRAQRVLDYDDLLVLLRDALTDPDSGPAATARVRERYRIVLVDEFQDTDPVQWQILRTAFHGHRTLVLIGDPKQAIYAFRGADVATYLIAAADARRQTLGRNWRADPAVLAGLAPILQGTALGDPRIVVHPIEPGLTGRRLDGGPGVLLRQITRAAVGALGPKPPPVGPVRDLLHRDVAAQVVHTLTTARLRDGDGWRPVEPGDIAILARKNKEAVAAQRALADVGVPAVISGLSSVFTTRAAQDWLALLSALARPSHQGAAAAAALTPFLGWDAARLALASDADRDEVNDRLRSWSRVLTDHGVASLLESTAADGLRERLLRRADGERRLTDLRHVGEALHAVATRQGMGAAALLEWLRGRIDEAAKDYSEERSRRLETDAAAVQVITVHASKGLQFPVVLVPYLWDRWSPSTPETLQYHRDDTRMLHVGGKGSPGYDEALRAARSDDVGETLRLAYVALTRAASQVVLWWAPSTNSPSGPLTRLLLGTRDAAGTPAASVPTTTDEATEVVLRTLVARAPEHLALEVVREPRPQVRWAPEARPSASLTVANLDRAVDTAWRRTSYSALTAGTHGGPADEVSPGVRYESEATGVDDEPETLGSIGAPVDGPLSRPSPMADQPAGARFGVVVHRALELLDTAAPDLRADLVAQCRRAGSDEPEALADALLPSIRTPLGPFAGDRALADIAARDRLAELDFELPLAGGATDHRLDDGVTVHDLAALLREHLPPGDAFAAYPGPARRAAGDPAARLPHGEHRRGAARAGTGRGRSSLPRRRLQDEPAGSVRRPADRVALPSRVDGGRDARRPLPAAAAALLGRAAPLPALAPAGIRTAGAPRWRPVPVPARHARPGQPDGRRHVVRRHGVATAPCARRRALRAARPEAPVTADAAFVAAVPWRARGLLGRLAQDGALVSADVHVAQRLGAIAGEADERVLLAVALTVRTLREGSVCLVLSEPLDGVDPALLPALEDWNTALRRSPLVADGVTGPADRPVRWVDGRVYLDRYWRDEQTVRAAIRLAAPAAADADALSLATARLFPSSVDEAQREALRTAATSHLTVLTGGPGTGKTTTVARLVAALQAAAGPGLRVALAAPTGKAAARLQEAVNAEVATLSPQDRDAVGSLDAMTIHRLLGWRRGSTTRFRHDRARPLPHDVVIVDESSMVSLPLMARLTEALRPTARLVLVGDPDQLASVEAGAVLGDLVAALPRGVVRLTHAHRYGASLAALAEAIRAGDADETLALLRSGDEHRTLVEPAGERLTDADLAGLHRDVESTGRALSAAARAGDATAALLALGTHRLLLAHREGPYGVTQWAATAETWVAAATGFASTGAWPLGRPLLVTENDRSVDLYNGDTGVIVADGDAVAVAFGDPENPRLVRPHQLPAVQPVHAMTVHRGQGSQFARVTLLLPPATSPLLTRELLYTAVTRAQQHVRVIGTEAAVRAAVERPVRRASGLREPR